MKVKIINGAFPCEIACSAGETVFDMLLKNGYAINSPCGGKGRCGKCKIKASGLLSPLSGSEKKHLSATEIENGYRLACQAKIQGDCVVHYENEIKPLHGLTEGMAVQTQTKPITGNKNCFACAVDIGTTTVAIRIFKMPECEPVYDECIGNPQIKFGGDIITRITYATENSTDDLKNAIRDAIKDVYKSFGKEISFSVITGNTAMLHFYEGLDTSTLALYPFTPSSLFGQMSENVYYPRCISAFVGADITCAILASGMMADKESLLIDLGTNGEMAYLKNGKLTCCSTAAGPAFEGAGISQGMAASDGAIDKVFLNNQGKIEYTVLGDSKAKGICGSGLIDAIACMLEIGVIDETGYIENDFEIDDSSIKITLEDIRAVQLAKSAIRAGIETLTKNKGDIETLYISGGFGNYVNKANCVKIGLIPNETKDIIKVVGNASLSGAGLILKNSDNINKSEEIAHSADIQELATDEFFIDKYIDYMYFQT
ncbi:MAG TPA: ASKHA domain-containing protein [Clostridia bacterium]|nr:ASKHA domain-containing protein [Clostridia bacterium]